MIQFFLKYNNIKIKIAKIIQSQVRRGKLFYYFFKERSYLHALPHDDKK